MQFKNLDLPLSLLLFFCFNLSLAQDEDYYEDEDDTYEEVEYLSPLNDKSLEGQKLLLKNFWTSQDILSKAYRYIKNSRTMLRFFE